MVSESVKAVVLAGGIAPWCGEPKALLRVNGTPLVLRVVTALHSLPEVSCIAVVGNPVVLQMLPKDVVKVEAAENLWTNTQKGIQAVQPEPNDYLLLCAADMPFVTAQSLQAFLEAAKRTGADLVYLAVPVEALQRFAQTKAVHRTSARLKEGMLTGGNLFLVRARIVPAIANLAERAIRYRKAKWQLAKLAGWRILLKWLLSRLPLLGNIFAVSVQELERRGEELLGCRCKGLIAPLPELAFDVDKPEDYALAQRLMEG